jgi:hypothetical protein
MHCRDALPFIRELLYSVGINDTVDHEASFMRVVIIDPRCV